MPPTIDARQLPDPTQLSTDICIVGAGAVGIAIALQLKNTPHRVCLIESGDLSLDDATQSLYDFENVGHPIRDDSPSRVRYFGGTTNIWTGRCLKLDPLDFEERDWVANSGWPITHSDLTPYYEQAAPLFKLPSLQKIEAEFWPPTSFYQDEQQVFADDQLAPVVSLRGRTSLNFRQTYLKTLQQASNIQIYLNANVLDVEAAENLETVSRLRLACLNGVQFTVKAKAYILACGGLENARILLLSRHQNSAGLGNQHDVVGRYYMDHPKAEYGTVWTQDQNFNAPLLFGDRTFTGTTQFGIRLSDAVQRQEKLLNHYVLLQPQFMNDGRSNPQRAGAIGKLRYFSRKLTRQPLQFDYLQIKSYLEQVPRWESRVTLSPQTDKLGLNQLQLNWKIGHQEIQDLHRFLGILKQSFKAQGIGEIKNVAPDHDPPFFNAFHHLGTTRMSHHPRDGVVDRNCQVHGIQNLFIAGTSVFPTGGYVNPTLPAVALALRLANHLQNRVQS
ncbi:MAG: GMC family oxidoreductase [Thermosynechococcaceae cyanobacterium]